MGWGGVGGSLGTAFGAHGEDAAHDIGEALPVGGIFGELLTAGAGDGVELGLAIVFRGSPGGVDPSALLKADEGGVDGSLVEEHRVAAGLLDAASDAVAVHLSHGGEGIEDHEVEGALQQIELGIAHWGVSCGVTTVAECGLCGNATEGGRFVQNDRKGLRIEAGIGRGFAAWVDFLYLGWVLRPD